MDNIFEFFKGFDLQQIIMTLAIIWFFTKDIKGELKEINKSLHFLDMRLIKLEGRFEERGYWESRDKKIGE